MKELKVGQQVICIDGRGANEPLDADEYNHMEEINKDHWVFENAIYTIRCIEEEDGEVWIGLKGIPDILFGAESFRDLKLDYVFVNLLLKNL